MNSNRIVQLVAVSLTILVLLGTGFFVIPKVREQRRALQLGFALKNNDTIPPNIAFASSMLGPLKGFMVNGLWYRVEQLKQQGKFAEINELSRLITTLQPRFPEVWRFHAWNMAYNVSVQTYTKEERWDWVNKGVRLLREEGIRYNPRAVRLYRELAWIFFHKIGQYSDDAHWYYKAELCREWQEILGVPSEGRDTEQTNAEFKKIVDAPETLEDLIAAQPLVRKLLDEQIVPAGYNIETGLPDNRRKERERLLRGIGKVLMFNYSARLEELPFELRPLPPIDEKLLPLLREPAHREPLGALLNYLRKVVLLENYRMEPATMLAIMDLFGPVDYRTASGHSLYWAHVGVELLGERLNRDNVDYINTLRHRIHAIQDLTDSGKLLFFPDTGTLDVLPDIRFAEPYLKSVRMAEAELAASEQGNDKPYEAGEENFMLKVFVLAYQSENRKLAAEFRDKAATQYGKKEHNIRTGRYLLTMDDHFLLEFKSLIENLESTRAFLFAMTQNAMLALASNDRKEFVNKMKLAQQAYETFMKSAEATNLTEQDRMGLEPGALFANNFIEILKQPSPVEFRSRLWRHAPLEVQQRVWDMLAPRFKADAEAAKLDPKKVFAEPPGMEAYRLTNPKPLPPLPKPPTIPGRQPAPGTTPGPEPVAPPKAPPSKGPLRE